MPEIKPSTSKPAAKDTTNTAAELAAFKACVSGGGKVSVTTNADGSLTETCTLNGAVSKGPTKPKEKPVEKATAALKFTKLEVTSDGTQSGTVIKVNGATVPNIYSANISWWGGSYGSFSLEYTTRDPEVKPGELAAYTTYRLRCPSSSGPCCASTQGSTTTVTNGEFDVSHSTTEPVPAAASAARSSQYAQMFK